MATTRDKFKAEQSDKLRAFFEARGIECENGRGEFQFFRARSPLDGRLKGFNHNENGVTYSPDEFDDLIEIFNAPVDPVNLEIVDSQHDSDLLDDFAIAALGGICANDNALRRFSADGAREMISPDVLVATAAYGIAKAMMAERAKHQPK